VIDSVIIAIDGAQDEITKVKGRSFLGKYINGSKDKEAISDACDVLDESLKSLLNKIKLANEGAIRG
jgi:hypothetical protein